MGLVTDRLRDLIARQVDEHGLVVWYDPERHYEAVVRHIDVREATVVSFEGSFFALRRQIDGLLAGLEPPRLIVYVADDPPQTSRALAEIEAAGVVLRPGQQPPSRNTRLAIVARNALKFLFGEATAATLEKQVEAGKLSLEELDALARKGEGITTGVVSILFGSGNPQEVALGFLAGERLDGELVRKEAVPELAVLLGAHFGVDLRSSSEPEAVRSRLARHILATDFLAGIGGEPPAALSGISRAKSSETIDACALLAKSWRLRRDLRESYARLAVRVEDELGISQLSLDSGRLAGSETFLNAERALQRMAAAALHDSPAEGQVELARRRQSSFWSEQVPDLQAGWALAAAAGQVLIEADRVKRLLRKASGSAAMLLREYAGGDRPLCLLDTAHRHMERRYHTFDFGFDSEHQELERLIAAARAGYSEAASILGMEFLRRFRGDHFRAEGHLRQVEIFPEKVRPSLTEGKTACVWVDSLRFEMARELAETLADDFEVGLEPALATVPTITAIGMAALLPGADTLRIVSTGPGRLAVSIAGKTVRERKDRVDYLESHAGVQVCDVRLDDLLPAPKKKARQEIQAADMVLVTSQEIDALCEGENIPLARRTMDDMLHELRRAFRVLGALGVKTIVVTADHGYLFGDEIGSEMKIDPPGGETVDLHRRVWVGRGGADDPACMRVRLGDLGIGGDFEIAVPWDLACFKVKGGGRAYFHGGMSLQELTIPVLTLRPAARLIPPSPIVWQLLPGRPKITTRFFSLQVKGESRDLFEIAAPKIRVELRAKGDCISTAVSASYGLEEGTGDLQLRQVAGDPRSIEPNTVTLMITKEPRQKTVTAHILDAGTGAELKRLEKIEVAISL